MGTAAVSCVRMVDWMAAISKRRRYAFARHIPDGQARAWHPAGT